LEDRVRRSAAVLATLREVPGLDLEGAVARELEIGLARVLRGEGFGDQSAVLRGSVELLLGAVEKVGRDVALAERYRAAEAEDAEGRVLRAGVAALERARWDAAPE
jgi:hypothetical protein